MNLPSFKRGDAKSIFNDLLIEFERADLTMINLECPLIDKPAPIVKNGPVLGVASDCINGLKQAGLDVLGLANNHIMDHGPGGLENTLRVCTEAGIATVGAGKNLREARRMLIRKVGDIRIAILAVAEHEFSIATENSWGADPLDLIDFVRNIKEQKENFDFLIVLLHGGNEHYPYPSPRIRDTCHFMAEMGARAIIVQHTHCPGCYEEYKNAHIVYGQGNLIFDWPNHGKAFYEGFLVKLFIAGDLSSTMHIVPYRQSETRVGINIMEKEKERTFREALEERSCFVTNDDFVNAEWLRFCEIRKHDYFNKALGLSRLFRKLNSRGLLSPYFYKTRPMAGLQNLISCEAHREVLETIFNHRLIQAR
ncbi:CapA family protein [candidate division KSB1 bacterium]|nr:CapA family protein [candidate division KSB1 bacterium]